MTATTRIQLLSDIHLEIERREEMGYDTFKILPAAPVLALLGDIGLASDERLFNFVRMQFETVLYVLGNHESYDSTYDETIAKFEGFEKEIAEEHTHHANLGEFFFLNRKTWSPRSSPDLVILGCTLWSQLNVNDLDILSWSMTDFNRIREMTPQRYDELHIRDCHWLENELHRLSLSQDKKIIIFTHHAPVIRGGSDPKFNGPNIPTSSGWVTDMTTPASGVDLAGRPRERGALLTSPLVHVWAFGHTHWCCDFQVGAGVRVVSNQGGYREGNDNRAHAFDEEFVLTL